MRPLGQLSLELEDLRVACREGCAHELQLFVPSGGLGGPGGARTWWLLRPADVARRLLPAGGGPGGREAGGAFGGRGGGAAGEAGQGAGPADALGVAGPALQLLQPPLQGPVELAVDARDVLLHGVQQRLCLSDAQDAGVMCAVHDLGELARDVVALLQDKQRLQGRGVHELRHVAGHDDGHVDLRLGVQEAPRLLAGVHAAVGAEVLHELALGAGVRLQEGRAGAEEAHAECALLGLLRLVEGNPEVARFHLVAQEEAAGYFQGPYRAGDAHQPSHAHHLRIRDVLVEVHVQFHAGAAEADAEQREVEEPPEVAEVLAAQAAEPQQELHEVEAHEDKVYGQPRRVRGAPAEAVVQRVLDADPDDVAGHDHRHGDGQDPGVGKQEEEPRPRGALLLHRGRPLQLRRVLLGGDAAQEHAAQEAHLGGLLVLARLQPSREVLQVRDLGGRALKAEAHAVQQHLLGAVIRDKLSILDLGPIVSPQQREEGLVHHARHGHGRRLIQHQVLQFLQRHRRRQRHQPQQAQGVPGQLEVGVVGRLVPQHRIQGSAWRQRTARGEDRERAVE
mmetsp:Transcript_81276/g.263234  ORF Transcript_81276/g.263234 Transcript_81276/m.263234 type:complete len:564 (+) Transcript_81276:247-1938(+)